MQQTERTPRVWLLLGRHFGDNQQLRALAALAGLPAETKKVRFLREWRATDRLAGATLKLLDPRRSDPIAPPWPDMVISIGRRSVAVARWIGKQSGGRCRLVHVGRPRGRFAWFDLIVAPPQYGIPAMRNVAPLPMPLSRWDEAAAAASAQQWAGQLDGLPRPWIAVCIGGAVAPYVLDIDAARRIAQMANSLARANGGSILMTTSPRTGEEVTAELARHLDCPHYFHAYDSSKPNPYRAFLHLCDHAWVSADSASMLSDAVLAGKSPEVIFLERRTRRRRNARAVLEALFERRFARERDRRAPDFLDRLADWLVAEGLAWPKRDVRRLHLALYKAGLARPLGAPDSPRPDTDATEQFSKAVAAVRALLPR